MSVKRKLSQAAVRHENPNERQLRSSRSHKSIPSDRELRSSRSPCKALDGHLADDFEVVGTERPLKLTKVASSPSRQKLASIYKAMDMKGIGSDGDEPHIVGLSIHQEKVNQHTSEQIIRSSPRTPKRNKTILEIPMSSPSKHASIQRAFTHDSAVMNDTNVPICLNAQKKEILRALQTSPLSNLDVPATEAVPQRQLSQLIEGSMTRGEGNSCIVLGPRGSGKTTIVENCIHNLVAQPIILRLTGWVQTTDKQALQEIATQLLHQTGSHLLSDTEPVCDDGNPFVEQPQVVQGTKSEQGVRLPPSSQLHALIPVLLTLKRPVIVILDAFDLFTLHPRQSLLYCLLDNVQSCRSTSGSQGMAVIGITSRVDTIQLLEKRVKSRFSGRIIQTAPLDLEHWLSIAKTSLLVPITLQEEWLNEEWHKKWTSSVETFLSDSRVLDVFRETFGISKDVKVLIRLLTHSVLHLRPSDPYLSLKILSAAVDSQRSRPRHTHVNNLPYPIVCLIIASRQVEITGHSTFSFEMLFENFRDQVRASTSAPVQLNGGHIGMVKCTREVLLAAFDDLVSSHIFLPSVGPSTVLQKEFLKYRCVLDREAMKNIVEKSGQTHLKKWFNKG